MSTQAEILLKLQEEVGNLPEDQQSNFSPYELALQGPKSSLAQSLKNIFEEFSHTGKCYDRCVLCSILYSIK